MSKTKKWTSLIFAIILGVLTCGVGLALPSFSKQSSKLETETAVNYDAAITESQQMIMKVTASKQQLLW